MMGGDEATDALSGINTLQCPIGIREGVCFAGVGVTLEKGGGVGWDPPSSEGPPMVTAEGGPKIVKRKSSLAPKQNSNAFGKAPRRGERDDHF